MHSGSLKSTKEARVALSYALSNSYASRVFSKLESIHNVIYAPIMWYTHAKHGWILKFRIEKHCLVKRFVFLKNVWDQYSNCRASSKLMFFTSCWLAHKQPSWNVLLFSCNLIRQLCLSGPSYGSRTAIYRLFAARHSRGTNPPCWRTIDAMGYDKQRAHII